MNCGFQMSKQFETDSVAMQQISYCISTRATCQILARVVISLAGPGQNILIFLPTRSMQNIFGASAASYTGEFIYTTLLL